MEELREYNMDAKTFYKKSMANQRQMVSDKINKARQQGNPIVKLPTQLYINIAEELRDLGWEEYVDDSNDVSWVYPICVDGVSDFPTVDRKSEFMSAQDFYTETLENQRKDLLKELETAVDGGLSEVKLPYKVYPCIRNEMTQNGWEHVIWHQDAKNKEECSMFYPICGF